MTYRRTSQINQFFLLLSSLYQLITITIVYFVLNLIYDSIKIAVNPINQTELGQTLPFFSRVQGGFSINCINNTGQSWIFKILVVVLRGRLQKIIKENIKKKITEHTIIYSLMKAKKHSINKYQNTVEVPK